MHLVDFYARYTYLIQNFKDSEEFVDDHKNVKGFLLCSTALGPAISVALVREGHFQLLCFEIFAGIIPTALAVTAVVIAGNMLAEKLWKMALAGIRIEQKAVEAISIASTVLSSIIAGFVVLVACKSAASALVMAISDTKEVGDYCLTRFYNRYRKYATNDTPLGAGHILFANFCFEGLTCHDNFYDEDIAKVVLFEIFAGIVPAALGAAGVILTGYFFAEQLCRTMLEGLIAQEAIKAIAIGGTVVSSIIGGAAMMLACKNIVSAIITGVARGDKLYVPITYTISNADGLMV